MDATQESLKRIEQLAREAQYAVTIWLRAGDVELWNADGPQPASAPGLYPLGLIGVLPSGKTRFAVLTEIDEPTQDRIVAMFVKLLAPKILQFFDTPPSREHMN